MSKEPKRDTVKETEDRAALLASKSFAVVTRDEDYPLAVIEEDFVQFLLERVVMMRELPYMQAAQAMETSQTKGPAIKSTHFAAKTQRLHSISVLRPTQPYDGNAYESN